MAGPRLTVLLLMVVVAWTCVSANGVYLSQDMAYSRTSPQHRQALESLKKSLTNYNDSYLKNNLRISECPPWQCKFGRVPVKVSRKCFKPLMCLPYHTDPEDLSHKDSIAGHACPRNTSMVGYIHMEACSCRYVKHQEQNITWALLNETMTLCRDEEKSPHKATAIQQKSTFFDKRPDIVTIFSKEYNAAIHVQVCRPRECAEGYNLTVIPNAAMPRTANIGRLKLQWDDEKCKCTKSNTDVFDRDVKDFELTVGNCLGENKKTKLENITSVLNWELRYCTEIEKMETLPKSSSSSEALPKPSSLSSLYVFKCFLYVALLILLVTTVITIILLRRNAPKLPTPPFISLDSETH